MLRTTALAAAIALVLAGAPAPAPAAITVPVVCSNGPVELAWDDTSYDLDGPCGVVRVTASNATVTMPTATKLVVSGRGNTIDAKPVGLLEVRGRDHEVRPVSVRTLRLASPGTVVAVSGLVETARLGRKGSTLTSEQVSTLVVRGSRHEVRTQRGFDARLRGDHNRVGYRLLDSLVVTGDDNTVRVRRGRTEVDDSGARNRIRLARRG